MSSPETTDPTMGELMARLSDQTSQLVREEIELAKAETAEKVGHGVRGVAGFGVAGLLALYGLAGLLAAAVFGLAEVLPLWAAALIVSAAVLAGAGVAALLGKREIGETGPVPPTRAIDGLNQDVATLRGKEQ